jgi:alanyl-tRNA synthetase
VAVFAGDDEEGYKYAIGTPEGDVRELAKEMNAALHGRGGGKPGFVQGSVQATAAEIDAFFGL